VFDIRFTDQPARPDHRAGEIVIANLRETFDADMRWWSAAQYETQWLRGVRLVLEAERSAVVTSFIEPRYANFIRWWPMYRDGDSVIFQEQILFMNQLAAPFDSERFADFVSPRAREVDEGEKVSEWRITTVDVRAFLERRER
jgi:hypothetical protein